MYLIGGLLYSPDSLYNVHAVHLTLPEFQNAMKATLRANDIPIGGPETFMDTIAATELPETDDPVKEISGPLPHGDPHGAGAMRIGAAGRSAITAMRLRIM